MTHRIFLSRRQAEQAGFTVDTTVSPWLAYKGARFRPVEDADVLTDKEAEMLRLILTLISSLGVATGKTAVPGDLVPVMKDLVEWAKQDLIEEGNLSANELVRRIIKQVWVPRVQELDKSVG